jgi:hypothetical protein
MVDRHFDPPQPLACGPDPDRLRTRPLPDRQPEQTDAAAALRVEGIGEGEESPAMRDPLARRVRRQLSRVEPGRE